MDTKKCGLSPVLLMALVATGHALTITGATGGQTTLYGGAGPGYDPGTGSLYDVTGVSAGSDAAATLRGLINSNYSNYPTTAYNAAMDTAISSLNITSHFIIDGSNLIPSDPTNVRSQLQATYTGSGNYN